MTIILLMNDNDYFIEKLGEVLISLRSFKEMYENTISLIDFFPSRKYEKIIFLTMDNIYESHY